MTRARRRGYSAESQPTCCELPAWPCLKVFYEGDGGSPAELALSLALTATLIFAPLTIASVGRRLWIKYKFTNKRVIIQNTSPLFKSEVGNASGLLRAGRDASKRSAHLNWA